MRTSSFQSQGSLNFQGRSKLQKAVDITPLIDVVFQLLLFFMLTSAIAVSQGMELNLPEAEKITSVSQEAIEVEIDKNGIIFVSGKETKQDAITDYLRMTLESPEKSQVVVRSDSDVPVSKLVEVMDKIRMVGITNLSIAAQSSSKKSDS
jgi:biopolymer transport protein ExbD